VVVVVVLALLVRATTALVVVEMALERITLGQPQLLQV
jgi:hypothetical protein